MRNLVEVVPMSLEHLVPVAAIEAASFPVPWSLQAFVQELLENSLAEYLVALRNGEVAGYAGAWVILDEAHVTNVAVRPDLRRLGIGRLLMEKLLERVFFLGARRVTLEVRVSNRQAKALYESLGFCTKGVRRGYYEDNKEDALIMWLELGV